MKKKFSREWGKSKQPRKQRKYAYNAPKNIKSKFLNAHLSKELAKKYKIRSLRVKKGDKVKIMRGQFRKKTGKIEKISLKNSKVYVNGIEMIKKDGTKVLYPIHPSNILITELNLDDKKRAEKLNKKQKSD
ncbi:MAG: 50S ribosomal protein L24 [Candidatus Nanoarchaeia archaeon]|nr:50S ribosomal protein L24 [Candidatus Nanoarchaeia archaeon]